MQGTDGNTLRVCANQLQSIHSTNKSLVPLPAAGHSAGQLRGAVNTPAIVPARGAIQVRMTGVKQWARFIPAGEWKPSEGRVASESVQQA